MADRVPTATLARLSSLVGEQGIRATSRQLKVAEATIRKSLRKEPVSLEVLAQLAKIAPHVRTADDYPRQPGVKPPRAKTDAYSWDLQAIAEARTAQLDGRFARPRAMAIALATCGEISIARRARREALAVVETELSPRGGSRGKSIAKRAAAGCTVTPETLADIHRTIVDHGIAIGYVEQETRKDASAVDFRLREWPLEFCEHDKTRDVLRTQTEDMSWQDITHGDGRWIIFRKSERRPWQTDDACILAACLVWAGIAEGNASWASTLRSHGLARLLASLPPEDPTRNKDGITPEVRALLDLLTNMLEGESPVGVLPGGVSAQFLANPSNAWQIFDTYGTSRARLAARIYTGTDAILGSSPDAPGMDISQLVDVASTLTASDARAIACGLNVGLYQPWTAINCGSTQYAPQFRFLLPDPDEERMRSEAATNLERLTATLERMRAQKLTVDQSTVDALCVAFGVRPAPLLVTDAGTTSSVVLAPADVAKVVRVSEARRAQGLEVFGDSRDNMTITELDESLKAAAVEKAAAAEAARNAAPPAAPTPPPAA